MKEEVHKHNEMYIKYLQDFLGHDRVYNFQRINRLGQDTIQYYKRVMYKDYEDYETVKKYLEQMSKFANNQWWLSKDLRVIAYYQLLTPILLVSISSFQEALEVLLKRKVYFAEIRFNKSKLKEEAEAAFKGTVNSEV